LIPEKDVSVKWETEFLSAFTAKATLSAPFELGPGEVETVSYNAYMGPKLYNLLRSYGAGLEEAIEFGFLSFLAKPFLVVLNFFERYLRNYGLAIIILTCIIKVVFHPLTRYSLHSMKEMQKIQPQLNALKQKYKDNKEKLNKELMALYKRYKINPLGGCLPMLMQIPVFIALYEVLSVAIELRHAPFAFWITDLSSKDPYYVTPLLMGATMFIQQKMTPSAMDPAQAKIMLLMPIVFTFLFMSFPSGLVLYWLVNNVLSIAQQYHIYKGKK
jgi:YidC/Oxa1 family membrane protein insertase